MSFGLSGVSALILLESINDISAGASAEAIIGGMKELVSRLRAKGQMKIVGATIEGAGDRLHPNRAGYQAMASAIDLAVFAPR